MAQEYELKQVKVRLRLAEEDPIYSTEQITSPDKAADVMSKVLAQMDREYCCVVNIDAGGHPINFNVVSMGDVNQTLVPVQNVFKSAILSNAASIMLFHNHPGGTIKASREDINLTKRLIEAGALMNIPVLDHVIVAGGTAECFSFRESNPEMFEIRNREESILYEPQTGIISDRLMVRPAYGKFGVYEMTGENRARVLFEGSEEECYGKIKEFRERSAHLSGETAEKEAQEIVKGFRSETERLFRSEKVDGMKPTDIEEAVRELVLQRIDEYGLDAAVEDVVVSGSRCRGLEKEDSDLDVVVSFSGSEREDDLFNLLHDEKLYFGSIELDINPINTEQTGTLAEYLPGVEKYLSEKKAERPVQQTAWELAAEIDRFAYENDTYEYKTAVKNREKNVHALAESIEKGKDNGARAYLTLFIEESEDAEAAAQAENLLKKLDDYKAYAKSEEIRDEDDNIIGNDADKVSQDSEEKKELKQEKVVCIEEHKKIRQKVSMRQKLAEKKAVIAGRDGRHPEVERGKLTRGTGVED